MSAGKRSERSWTVCTRMSIALSGFDAERRMTTETGAPVAEAVQDRLEDIGALAGVAAPARRLGVKLEGAVCPTWISVVVPRFKASPA